MAVQESNLGEGMQERAYEEGETLSLSDLPLYGHVEWEEEEEEALSSLNQQDYFDFNFSQDLSPAATAALSPPDNVVFCGKLIPYKQPSHHVSDMDPLRTCESAKKQVSDGKNKPTTRRIPSEKGYRKDHHVRSPLQRSHFRLSCKMSMLTSSSSGKARWYLFFFGIRSFSTKMELRDIRSRQSRCQYSSQPPPSPVLSSNGDQVVSKVRNRSWGFWAVIRALSCGGNPTNHTETSMTPFNRTKEC